MTHSTALASQARSFPQTKDRAGYAKSRSADRFWPVLRDLIEARTAFGLRRPVLATLRALISFLEEGSTVFASNRSISARAEGISESALRRHIRALVDMGLVIRRDSSNGKRYRIEAEGQDELVFGIDLSPLWNAAGRISEAAERCRQESRLIRHLRKKLGQMIFAARSFGHAGEEIDRYQKALRQKLSATEYQMLCENLSQLEDFSVLEKDVLHPGLVNAENTAFDAGEIAITSKMTGRDIQNDCHKNITEERILISVSEKRPDPEGDRRGSELALFREAEAPETEVTLLRKARALAPEAFTFAEVAPQTWAEVEVLAWHLASWSGISRALLSEAVEAAGQRMTAMAVLLVTQNAGRIRNPGAYFRTLTLGRHFARFSRPLAHLDQL